MSRSKPDIPHQKFVQLSTALTVRKFDYQVKWDHRSRDSQNKVAFTVNNNVVTEVLIISDSLKIRAPSVANPEANNTTITWSVDQ